MKKTIHSFFVAFRGILFCINNEPHMRFHLVATVFVAIFMNFFPLARAEKALLFVTIGLVISAEMLNTALEVIIDKISPQYSVMAQNVKDIAAGAVFVTAVAAVVVASFLFINVEGFMNMYNFFMDNIALLIGVIILGCVSILFVIFGLPHRKTKSLRRNK